MYVSIQETASSLRIPAGFPGAASVYYYCDDMPSVVMYEYQWDASQWESKRKKMVETVKRSSYWSIWQW